MQVLDISMNRTLGCLSLSTAACASLRCLCCSTQVVAAGAASGLLRCCTSLEEIDLLWDFSPEGELVDLEELVEEREALRVMQGPVLEALHALPRLRLVSVQRALRAQLRPNLRRARS